MSFLLPNQLAAFGGGLNQNQVNAHLQKYGKNTLTKGKQTTFLKQYLLAFCDPIIKILLVALALNVLIALKNSNIYEPLGIAISLFLSTFVSALSEYGSQSAFLKLSAQYSDATVRVYRNSRLCVLPVSDITVGDRVVLSAGERVSADGVIIKGRVFVDMSALNGESAEKERYCTKTGDKWELLDKAQLFCGSVITSGECEMVVGRIGDDTFLGGVAKEVQSGSDTSPLTKRLFKLAGLIGKIGYAAAVLVFFADLFNALVIESGFNLEIIKLTVMSKDIFGILLHSLTLAITVVVVAVPEGLPMMITVVLSSNMSRLKRDNVLVKKLAGIETAGCINMLFCDKTGTLTTGKLNVIDVYNMQGKSVKQLLNNDMRLCLGANNDSSIIGKKITGGNATDRALLKFVGKVDAAISQKIPFDSDKKYSAVMCGGKWYAKGAPELFLKDKTEAYKIWQTLATNGVRVIAMATGDTLLNLEPIGIVAINDSLRKDTKGSVALLKQAGINVCMVTGDNLLTAKSIAKESGILKNGDLAITHAELEAMSDSEVISVFDRLKVVARALPQDKSRLVRLCKESGTTCAMTGDGINDAPALKAADVGFAMGSGTEVAKEAGDIVILDDNILSITKAVLYGRTIFKSIRKFIVFQLTINMCAVGISVIGPFIGIDTPVTVVQMLWINMIMDTLAGLAFAGEAPNKRYMKEKPLSASAQVLNRQSVMQIAVMSGYSLLLCITYLATNLFRVKFLYYTDYGVYMSIFFALFVFLGLFAAICARVPTALNLFSGLSKNRAFMFIFGVIAMTQVIIIYFGKSIFRTVPIPLNMLFEAICISATIVIADFLRKLFLKNR